MKLGSLVILNWMYVLTSYNNTKYFLRSKFQNFHISYEEKSILWSYVNGSGNLLDHLKADRFFQILVHCVHPFKVVDTKHFLHSNDQLCIQSFWICIFLHMPPFNNIFVNIVACPVWVFLKLNQQQASHP